MWYIAPKLVICILFPFVSSKKYGPKHDDPKHPIFSTADEVGILVLNGTEVFPKFKYEFMVDNGSCGSSLIAPNILLTAAHCNSASLTKASIGKHNRSDVTEILEEIKIVERVPHPDYDDYTLEADIMVMRLCSKSKHQPVTLVDDTNIIQENAIMKMMGWGLTDCVGDDKHEVLLEGLVDYVNNEDCQAAYDNGYDDEIFDGMLCASRPGIGPHYGDSGGPLIDESGKQTGVVSWGVGCYQTQYPDVYTRVSHYIEWINEYKTLWQQYENDECPTSSPTMSAVPTAQCFNYGGYSDCDGDGCEWYEENEERGCPMYGDFTDTCTGEITGNMACCRCGGGTSDPPPTVSPATSAVPTAQCFNYDGYSDCYDTGCAWYEENEERGCPIYGELTDECTGEITGNMACCHCGGGTSDPPYAGLYVHQIKNKSVYADNNQNWIPSVNLIVMSAGEPVKGVRIVGNFLNDDREKVRVTSEKKTNKNGFVRVDGPKLKSITSETKFRVVNFTRKRGKEYDKSYINNVRKKKLKPKQSSLISFDEIESL